MDPYQNVVSIIFSITIFPHYWLYILKLSTRAGANNFSWGGGGVKVIKCRLKYLFYQHEFNEKFL